MLLALAAVATSWSSYQATRWNGEQSKASSRANSLRISAARSDGLARSQQQVDVATYIAWVEARLDGNAELETFYLERFRPEFRVAFDAWQATDPFTDPAAPSTPFAMEEYQLAAAAEAERLGAEAEANSARARASVDRAGNYVLGVVLFAVALFFGGMSAKVTHPTTKRVMVWIGIIVFVVAFARVATYPIRLTA